MKKRERILIVWAAAFVMLAAVLGLGAIHPLFVAAMVPLIFAAQMLFLRGADRRILRELMAELQRLQQNPTPRDYSAYPPEMRAFLETLAEVGHTLYTRGRTQQEVLNIVHSLGLEFEPFLQELMPKLAELTRSTGCAFYSVSQSTKLSLKHSIGFGKNLYSEFDLTLGEGFIGPLALKNESTIVHDVPDDTSYVLRTFLGKIKPRNVMVTPILHQGQLNGILVCASIHLYTEEERSLVDMAKYFLGVAVGNGLNAEKNKRLANELTFQNKLIQDQHEDIRKQLHAKAQLLTALLNTRNDIAVCVLSSDGRLQSWNQSAASLYGMPRAMGQPLEHIHSELGWPPIAQVLQNLSPHQSLDYCLWVDEADGSRRRFEMQFTCMMDDEACLGIKVEIKPIT